MLNLPTFENTSPLPPISEHTAIGRDVETNREVVLGDTERCGGLYILGKPRMGKSWLLVNLIAQDIHNTHGVFFLDPHGDAIDDLIRRYPLSDRCLLFDPEHEESSFAFNVLACKDIESPKARADTFTKAKGIFDKLWKNTFEEKPWLQIILQNTIYAFLENQGFTIAEFPLFFRDPEFRRHIASQMRYNRQVADYWLKTFAAKGKRDQDTQMEAAQTRVEIMLGNPYVSHMLGQRESTIDFASIIEEAKVIFFRLSSHMSYESKRIIGTVLISELLHAIQRRPANNRRHFSILVDEFQTFAAYQDFSTLITQAPKFGVATTVAHHERYGQLADQPEMLGATDAIANKVLFQITAKDAADLSTDFAEEPPVEIRREQALVISQTPFTDLLHRGHKNPHVQAFVTKYLRPMRDRREDAKEEMEKERLIRMEYFDEAGLYALDERIESLGNYERHVRLRALQKRGSALQKVGAQTRELLRLFDLHNNLRLTERELNSFLAGVMEGRNAQGQEQFSNFLLSLVEGFEGVESGCAQALALYIALSYGDHIVPRSVPFGFASAHDLYSQEVALLTDQSEQKTREERQKFKTRFLVEEEERKMNWWREERRDGRKRALQRDSYLLTKRQNNGVGGGNTERRWITILSEEKSLWYPPNLYSRYVWLAHFREVYKMLAPYHRAKFSQDWKSFMPWASNGDRVAKLLTSLETLKEWDCCHGIYEEYWKESTVRDLIAFVDKFKESGLVMLALLDCAANGSWGDGSNAVPGIEKRDPIDVWCSVETLRRFMHDKLRRQWFSHVFRRYFNCRSSSWESDVERLEDAKFLTSVAEKSIYEALKGREDVRWLEKLLRWRWSWFSGKYKTEAVLWNKLDECKRSYLLARAADRLTYGIGYREEGLCLPASGYPLYEEIVSGLVDLSQDTQAWIDEEDEKRETETQRRDIAERCEKEIARISFSPPDMLDPRVLSMSEIRDARQACINELRQAGEETRGVVATIDEFVQFCALLSRPENHIQVPCGQYIEREVRARQEGDMSNEVARKLTELPKYTAYAKLMKQIEGEHIVWKGRIQTLQLARELAEEEAKARRAAIEQNSMQYLKSRALIEEEIRERQERWRSRVIEEPPRTQSAIVNGRSAPPEAGDIAVDEPPPPTQSQPGGESDEPPSSHS